MEEEYGLEQLTPGTIDGVGIVMITENESLIPHFTIIRQDRSEVIIAIQDNKYLSENELTSEECIKLNHWMRDHQEKTNYNLGLLNWRNVIFDWNALYNDRAIKYQNEEYYENNIPDYTVIKPYKE